jgi:hypothetical protein
MEGVLAMKVCKTCKGKGWLFVKATVFSGWDKFMGFEIPRTTLGMQKSLCSKCFGRGKF